MQRKKAILCARMLCICALFFALSNFALALNDKNAVYGFGDRLAIQVENGASIINLPNISISSNGSSLVVIALGSAQVGLGDKVYEFAEIDVAAQKGKPFDYSWAELSYPFPGDVEVYKFDDGIGGIPSVSFGKINAQLDTYGNDLLFSGPCSIKIIKTDGTVVKARNKSIKLISSGKANKFVTLRDIKIQQGKLAEFVKQREIAKQQEEKDSHGAILPNGIKVIIADNKTTIVDAEYHFTARPSGSDGSVVNITADPGWVLNVHYRDVRGIEDSYGVKSIYIGWEYGPSSFNPDDHETIGIYPGRIFAYDTSQNASTVRFDATCAEIKATSGQRRITGGWLDIDMFNGDKYGAFDGKIDLLPSSPMTKAVYESEPGRRLSWDEWEKKTWEYCKAEGAIEEARQAQRPSGLGGVVYDIVNPPKEFKMPDFDE